MITTYRAALIVAVLCISAAYPANVAYVGDGQLIDHGKHHLTNRYEVVLGAVNIGNTEEFQFRGLPHREFILGLRLDAANCKLMQSAATVSFTVRNERGVSVINEQRSLRDLVWQTTLGRECQLPFGYVRSSVGAARGESDCASSSANAKADQVRGTYFVARREGAYQVQIATQTPDGMTVTGTAAVVLQDNGVPPPPNCR